MSYNIQLLGIQFLLLLLRRCGTSPTFYQHECENGKTMKLTAPYYSDSLNRITSPGYPFYDRGSNCEVRIKSKEEDLKVHVRIMKINIGNLFGQCDSETNYLKIYDGANDTAPPLGQYCSNEVGVIKSSKEYLFIKFKLDNEYYRTGIFELEYYTEDKSTSTTNKDAIVGACIGSFVFIAVVVISVMCNLSRIKKHCSCCCFCNCFCCSVPEPETSPTLPITIAELPTAPNINSDPPFSNNLPNVGNHASPYINKHMNDVTNNYDPPPSYEDVMGNSSKYEHVPVTTDAVQSVNFTELSVPSNSYTHPSAPSFSSTQSTAPSISFTQPTAPSISFTQPTAPSMVNVQLR